MIVVDIREPREIAVSGAATVALRLPLATLRMRADPRSPECHPDLKNGKPVLLYCASGGRAGMAADMLREFGHAEVHNLGGLADWQAAGGPVAH
jgi:rhodanese-related sulfurtransferase